MAILIMVIGLYKKYVNFKNGYINNGLLVWLY